MKVQSSSAATDLVKALSRKIAEVVSAIFVISGFEYVIGKDRPGHLRLDVLLASLQNQQNATP